MRSVYRFFHRVGYNGCGWELTSESVASKIVKVLRVVPAKFGVEFRPHILSVIVNERLGTKLVASNCRHHQDFEKNVTLLLECNDVETLVMIAREYFGDVVVNLEQALACQTLARSKFEMSIYSVKPKLIGDVRLLYTSLRCCEALRSTHATFIFKQLDLQGCILSVSTSLSSYIRDLCDDVVSREMKFAEMCYEGRKFVVLCFDDHELRCQLLKDVTRSISSNLSLP